MKASVTAVCLGGFLAGGSFAAEGEKVLEYSFGRQIQTAPAVDNDGTVFIAGEGQVAALSANGTQKWKVELSPGSRAIVGGISIGSDRIFATSSEGIFALDKNGGSLWTNSLNTSNSCVALAGTNLYAVDHNAVLHSLTSDGGVIWTTNLQPGYPTEMFEQLGVSVSLEGNLYVSVGRLTAVSRMGEKLWAAGPETTFTASPVIRGDGRIYADAVSGNITPLLQLYDTNGTVITNLSLNGRASGGFVIGPDNSIYVPIEPAQFNPNKGLVVFDSNGAEKWRFSELTPDAAPVVAANGTVYFAGEGKLVALASTGVELWRYTNGVAAVKGLAIGSGGTVLLAQTDGKLIGVSGTSPLATSVWPIYGRDARHTFQQRPSLQVVLTVDDIGTNSATVHAQVNPGGTATEVYFVVSSSGGQSQTPVQQVPATNGTVEVTRALTGLTEGTLYTVEMVSSNQFGVARSEPVSFRTLGGQQEVPPTLASLQAVASAGGTVKFSGDGVISISTPVEFRADAVVDANGHQVILTGNGQSSLLRFVTGVDVTLKGLSLVDGKAPSAPESVNTVSKGGAIVNNGADLTLIDCTFSNNVAHVVTPAPPGVAISAGGAIWQSGGSLVVQDCRFLDNRASGDIYQQQLGGVFLVNYPQARGGAIFLTGGSAEISNSIFERNHLSNGLPSEGGAIYSADGAFLVSSSTLSANSADVLPRGGAIYLGSGNLTVTNSTLANNTVAAAPPTARLQLDGSAFGAALFNAGTMLVRNSAILANQTIGGQGGGSFGVPAGPSSGGGIFNTGTLAVDNSTFGGNSSRSSLLFAGSSSPSHVPGEASAIYSSGTAGITNVTIAWNTNATAAVRGANATNVVLKNTLLAGGQTDVTAETFTDAGHNMTTGPAAFTHTNSETNVDPRLGPIGYYGGSTLVYPLRAGSKAINAADDAVAPAIDQRGRARPFGPHADIGAFESSPPFHLWGNVQGYHDPSTALSFGTNSVTVDTNGFFMVGPLSAGTNEITIAATNSLFLPNPWVVDVQGDDELNAITSFQLHTLTFSGTPDAPVFVLAGLPGEKWKVESSANLHAWEQVGSFTLDASGLVQIPVPKSPALFLRVSAEN